MLPFLSATTPALLISPTCAGSRQFLLQAVEKRDDFAPGQSTMNATGILWSGYSIEWTASDADGIACMGITEE